MSKKQAYASVKPIRFSLFFKFMTQNGSTIDFIDNINFALFTCMFRMTADYNFAKLLEKLCFEEHQKRQPLYSKQLPLMKYEIENLSVYGGIPRTHFLEVFIYHAYRS